LGKFAADRADQPAVLRQAEQEIDPVQFAPLHQRLAAEAAIGAQQDAHPRPAGADLPDDARGLLDCPGRAVDVGPAQFGGQQMPAAEDIERQIAVAVVIAVEKAPFLMPVQRVVGGVEIENDLLRRSGMGIEKEVDKNPLDRRQIVADLAIGRDLVAAQFQPVERRFAGHRRTVLAPRPQLAGQHRQDRIVAQLVVIDHILVAQGDPEDALADQGADRVLHQVRRPAVGKTLGKAPDQPDRPVGRSQQQTAGIRGDLATVKGGHHRAPLDACKTEQICATLCRHRGTFWTRDKPLLQHDFLRVRVPMHLSRMRNPG
jgi:hypothetical protein